MAKRKRSKQMHPAVLAVIALVALAGGGYAVVKLGPKITGKGKKSARGPHRTDPTQHVIGEITKPQNAEHVKALAAVAKQIAEALA